MACIVSARNVFLYLTGYILFTRYANNKLHKLLIVNSALVNNGHCSTLSASCHSGNFRNPINISHRRCLKNKSVVRSDLMRSASCAAHSQFFAAGECKIHVISKLILICIYLAHRFYHQSASKTVIKSLGFKQSAVFAKLNEIGFERAKVAYLNVFFCLFLGRSANCMNRLHGNNAAIEPVRHTHSDSSACHNSRVGAHH